MLAACGTNEFYGYSSQLYGTPLAVLADEVSTSHAMASRFDTLITSFSNLDLGAPPSACHLALGVAQDLELAIQMLIDSADFLDVYRYFLERTGSEEQAFENSRRVLRGGVVSGGAPFTKDVVHLDGLLRVHNFLRAMVSSGRADCLRLLFCGKLDIEDIPVLYELSQLGLCQHMAWPCPSPEQQPQPNRSDNRTDSQGDW